MHINLPFILLYYNPKICKKRSPYGLLTGDILGVSLHKSGGIPKTGDHDALSYFFRSGTCD